MSAENFILERDEAFLLRRIEQLERDVLRLQLDKEDAAESLKIQVEMRDAWSKRAIEWGWPDSALRREGSTYVER